MMKKLFILCAALASCISLTSTLQAKIVFAEKWVDPTGAKPPVILLGDTHENVKRDDEELQAELAQKADELAELISRYGNYVVIPEYIPGVEAQSVMKSCDYRMNHLVGQFGSRVTSDDSPVQAVCTDVRQYLMLLLDRFIAHQKLLRNPEDGGLQEKVEVYSNQELSELLHLQRTAQQAIWHTPMDAAAHFQFQVDDKYEQAFQKAKNKTALLLAHQQAFNALYEMLLDKTTDEMYTQAKEHYLQHAEVDDQLRPSFDYDNNFRIENLFDLTCDHLLSKKLQELGHSLSMFSLPRPEHLSPFIEQIKIDESGVTVFPEQMDVRFLDELGKTQEEVMERLTLLTPSVRIINELLETELFEEISSFKINSLSYFIHEFATHLAFLTDEITVGHIIQSSTPLVVYLGGSHVLNVANKLELLGYEKVGGTLGQESRNLTLRVLQSAEVEDHSAMTLEECFALPALEFDELAPLFENQQNE